MVDPAAVSRPRPDPAAVTVERPHAPDAAGADAASRPRLTDALPVEVAWEGPAGDRVRHWLEATLGWQPVDAATAVVVPPVCGVANLAGLGAVTRPAVLLVATDDDVLDAALVGAAQRPDAVLRWPGDRERLPAVVANLLSVRPGGGGDATELSIGGGAGGVGTTTVALALGGLVAWAGRSALVVTHGAVPAATGPTLAVDDLAGAGAWRTARPVPGVPGLRVLRAAQPARTAAVASDGAAVVVRDAGVDADADVLVIRRDRAGIAALRRTAAGVVVVTDSGPAPVRALEEAAGGRALVVLPWSHRVARAGLAGRVPASIPGTWLRALRPVVARRR